VQKGFPARRKDGTRQKSPDTAKPGKQSAVNPQIREEVYQQAAIDVLDGKGYCWNISLDTIRARNMVWGDPKTIQFKCPQTI
jgi:hypothetical protein